MCLGILHIYIRKGDAITRRQVLILFLLFSNPNHTNSSHIRIALEKDRILSAKHDRLLAGHLRGQVSFFRLKSSDDIERDIAIQKSLMESSQQLYLENVDSPHPAR